MSGKRKVVVVEKNYIIGLHIIELLKSKGHVVYNNIVRIEALGGVCCSFEPDVIIIHKRLFYDNYNTLAIQLSEIATILFIVLYTITPGSPDTIDTSKLKYIEKPFLSYEIPELISI